MSSKRHIINVPLQYVRRHNDLTTVNHLPWTEATQDLTGHKPVIINRSL